MRGEGNRKKDLDMNRHVLRDIHAWQNGTETFILAAAAAVATEAPRKYVLFDVERDISNPAGLESDNTPIDQLMSFALGGYEGAVGYAYPRPVIERALELCAGDLCGNRADAGAVETLLVIRPQGDRAARELFGDIGTMQAYVLGTGSGAKSLLDGLGCGQMARPLERKKVIDYFMRVDYLFKLVGEGAIVSPEAVERRRRLQQEPAVGEHSTGW